MCVPTTANCSDSNRWYACSVSASEQNLTMTLHMLMEGAARSQINRWYNSNSIIGNASSVYKQVVFSTGKIHVTLVTNKETI